MKKRTFLIMMVTVAMTASIYTGCGSKENAVEDTSYSADVHIDKENADIPATEKTAMEQQDQEQKKPENKTEIKTSAADPATKAESKTETKPNATKQDAIKEESKTEAKADTTKVDTKSIKAASPKVDGTAAEKSQDIASAKAPEAQGNGSVNYFIGTHAGDPSQKITSVSRSNSTNQTGSSTQQKSKDNTQGDSQETSDRQPQMTADHEHVWKEVMHTRYEWVSDIVTVDDYEIETKTVLYAHCNCGAVLTEAEYPAHYQAHEDKGECSDSYTEAEEVEVGRTKVGSHEEDHGHQEPVTYVDHVECEICKIDQKVWNP